MTARTDGFPPRCGRSVGRSNQGTGHARTKCMRTRAAPAGVHCPPGGAPATGLRLRHRLALLLHLAVIVRGGFPLCLEGFLLAPHRLFLGLLLCLERVALRFLLGIERFAVSFLAGLEGVPFGLLLCLERIALALHGLLVSLELRVEGFLLLFHGLLLDRHRVGLLHGRLLRLLLTLHGFLLSLLLRLNRFLLTLHGLLLGAPLRLGGLLLALVREEPATR